MTKPIAPNFPAILIAGNPGNIRQIDKDLFQELNSWEQSIRTILDKGISFDDNVDIKRVSVTSHATPGTEFSVAHTLGKTPTGYIVTGQAGAGTIYDGTTANDATTLYLRSDASSVSFRVMVF